MTETETKLLLSAIVESAQYPAFKPTHGTTGIWAEVLAPYSYAEIMAGLKTYLRSYTGDITPKIADIIAAARKTLSTGLSDGEAWGLVVLAMRNSTYGAEQEFAKLPEAVRRAVGSPAVLTSWGQLAESSLAGAEASFKRSYKTEMQRAESRASAGQRISLAETAGMERLPEAHPPLIESHEKHRLTDEMVQKVLDRLDSHARDTPGTVRNGS